MSTQKHICPECGGERMVGHPSLFTWRHEMTCSLLRYEDATADADATWIRSLGTTNDIGWARREMSPTEWRLLAACGIELDEHETRDCVTAINYSIGIRRRVFGYAGSAPVLVEPLDSITPGVRFLPIEDDAPDV